MDALEITAGQLHQTGTTFLIEFYNGDSGHLLSSVHLKFVSWMSFEIIENFEIANIYFGEPVDDYTIEGSCDEPCELGDLNKNEKIMEGFKYIINTYMKSGFTFNIYENLLKDHDKFKFLAPTFNTSE